MSDSSGLHSRNRATVFYLSSARFYIVGIAEQDRTRPTVCYLSSAGFYSRSGAMMDATYSASRLLFNASDCLARKLSIKAQALTLVRTVLNEQCDGLQRCSLVKLKLTCFDLGSEEEYQDDLEDVSSQLSLVLYCHTFK